MGDRLAERYEIVDLLGEGGFGQTFVANDHYLPGQPLCVIKQLKPYAQDQQTLETAARLFELEAETLYRLGDHDQIPRLLAHFEQKGEFYLVQDYIPGTSLQSEISEQSPLSVPSVTSLLHDLLTVLAFVHQQQVIHRDVKPANLICRESDGKIVLIDFGAVKKLSLQPGGNHTIAIGSTGYMAPEQQASRPCFASDLYAVGMIALYSLTGLSPRDFPREPGSNEITCASLGLTLEPDLTTFLNRLVRYNHHDRFLDAQNALKALTQLHARSSQNVIPPSASADVTFIPDQTYLPEGPIARQAQGQPLQPSPTSPTFPPSLAPSAPTTTPPLSPLTQQSFRNRTALLNKVRNFWIQGVLERSLHGQVMLALGLEERPDAIATPWNITCELEGQSARSLPTGSQVIDVFDRIGEGCSLLILGEPGAGKTTTLLTLARDLLHRAEQNSTIRLPVVFNLSSWRKEPISVWLITELNSKYQVPKAIGRTWVEQQQLLLLLDGLDEVSAESRDDCVIAINQFHQEYSPEMVVCSRIKDYNNLTHRLTFQNALYLRALTHEQIWQYLNRVNSGLTGLKALLEQESVLQDSATSLLNLARSPLMLSIMVLAYQGVEPEEIPRFSQTKDYRKQLFDAYIARMFQRRQLQATPYSQQQTIRWLKHLADRLHQTSQTVFMIERMQPIDWLQSTRTKVGYTVGLWLSFLTIAVTIGTQVLSPERLILALLIGGIIMGRIFGLFRISPAETLRWDWKKARNNLALGLTIGPIIGWSLKVGFGLIFANSNCLNQPACITEFSIIGLSFGAMLGLTFGLIRGLSGTRVVNASWPNQGIWQSARNSLLFALVATVTLFIPGLLIGNTKATFWAASGLAFGLAAGGGEAVVKHFILRLILFLKGVVPWNYARFLDYAAERIFLQKVGGGYIFVHRLLLEHFTELPGNNRKG